MAFKKKPLGTLDNILCDHGHVCPEGGFLQIKRFDIEGNSGLHLQELSDHFPIEGILYFRKKKIPDPRQASGIQGF